MSQEHAVHEPQQDWSLFVEFGNTLDFEPAEPVDRLPSPEALLGWLRSHGLISERDERSALGRLARDPGEGERSLERFHETRRIVRSIAEGLDAGRAPSRTLLTELNRALRDGLHYHEIRQVDDGTRFAFRQVGDELEQARAAIAGSMADFLVNGPTGRIRTCDNHGCRWLFIDHSPTGRRRWCDMASCGNRAKAARHRARVKGARQPSGRKGQPARDTRP